MRPFLEISQSIAFDARLRLRVSHFQYLSTFSIAVKHGLVHTNDLCTFFNDWIMIGALLQL